MNKLRLCFLSILILLFSNPPDSANAQEKEKVAPQGKISGRQAVEKEKTSNLQLHTYSVTTDLKFLTINGIFTTSIIDQNNNSYPASSKFTIDTALILKDDEKPPQSLTKAPLHKPDDTQNHFWSDYYSRAFAFTNHNIKLRRFKSTLKDFNEHSLVIFSGLKISMKWE